MVGEGRVEIQFELLGEKKLAGFLNHVKHIPDDWSGAWDPMADDFRASESAIFAEQGPGWAPLSPRYSKWKAKHYPGMPLLVRTGALQASLTVPDAEGNINEIYPTEMILGSDLKVPSGKYTLGMLHQTGTRPHKGSPNGMPARPPVIIRPELQRKWHDRLTKWMQIEFGHRGD